MTNEPGPAVVQVDATQVVVAGRRLVYFGGCDYFRLSRHPAVVGALRHGVLAHGVGVAASRMTTGNHPVYGALEREVAEYFGVPAAVLLPCGSLTNLAVAAALAGRFERVLLDARAHTCLREAAGRFGCPVVEFAHRSVAGAAEAAGGSQRGGRIMLLTDGVFGHDGSVAPLAGYRRVLPRTAWMLVDDAHGAGVVGVGGRGAVEHTGAGRARIIQTMTLSKAFGVYGGVVLGSVDVIRAVTGGGWFGGSTPLPPAVAEAARRAVACLRRGAARRRRLAANVAWVRRALGREVESREEFPGAVVSVVPKDPRSAESLRRALVRRGVFPSHIRYPGGPAGGYFRFAISSEHRRSELGALVEAVRSVGEV